jgi:uncharacterized membrane protein YdjX (TVP38/TMEM64 family)
MKTGTRCLAATAAILACVAAVWHLPACWEVLEHAYAFVTDREQLKPFLTSFGAAAPVAFIFLQILQVIFAPFPGEISGVIGGYLFGALAGFLYSSIGLAVGSWINFTIGRFMGKQYIRKRIPPKKLNRLDALLKRQGLLLVFFLFIFPGFPKDYLCLFLGLSTIPAKIFILMATVGRMPGTLLLSLQGAALFDRMYGVFTGILAGCLLLGWLAYRYRETIYVWVERLNKV